MQQINACIGHRQRFGIGADTCERMQPAAMLARGAQHRYREIERNRLGFGIAFAQQGGSAARSAADIENALGREGSVIEAFLQAFLNFILEERMRLVSGRGATEGATDFRRIENSAHAAMTRFANALIASAT